MPALWTLCGEKSATLWLKVKQAPFVPRFLTVLLETSTTHDTRTLTITTTTPTAGPMAGTVADFWSMIWEQNITCLVMVTQLREKEKEKCFQYWPVTTGQESEPFGDVAVKMLKVSIGALLLVDVGFEILVSFSEWRCCGGLRRRGWVGCKSSNEDFQTSLAGNVWWCVSSVCVSE
jgi:hypothetical protein